MTKREYQDYSRLGFNLGFWGCMLPCLIVNCWSYFDVVQYTNAPFEFSGCDFNGGFPVSWLGGCMGNPDSLTIYWLFLIANLLLTLIFSFVCGRIIKYVSSNSGRY